MAIFVQNITVFFPIKRVYIVTLLLLSGCFCLAQGDIRFSHLSMEDGLPNNTVNCIFQDSSGFIWIGTRGGLSRYDGNTIITFTHNENDSTTLANNQVVCIYEDTRHAIWIGTNFGLSKFNPVKKNFTNYYFDKWSSNSESSLVTNIIQDNKGILWVATGAGIYKALPADPHFSPAVLFTEDHYGSLFHGMVNTADGRIFILMDTALLYTDDYGSSFKTAVNSKVSDKMAFTQLYYDKSNGHLWFGIYGHSVACEFDPKTFEFKKYALESQSNEQFNFMACDFCRLNDSIMLAGCLFGYKNTEGSLAFLNTKRNSCEDYFHHYEDPFSLSGGNVYCILKDCQNTFWMGTDVGINSFNLQQLNFHWISTENIHVPSLDGFSITQLCYDEDLWIGTVSSGLVKYKSSDHSFSWYPRPLSSPGKKYKEITFSMYPSHDTLWLGIRGGFNRFDIHKHKFDTVKIHIPELKELYSNTTRGISRDNSGTYWFGTYMNGIFSYNPSTGIGGHYLARDTGLITKYRNHIRCMTVDVEGNKWIGTYEDGFCRMDAATNHISWNIPGDKAATVMQRGTINDIYSDGTGNTYIATQGNGLVIYDANTRSFRTIRNNICPEDNKIDKIVECDKGILWLATGKGLSCWDLKNITFRNYQEGKRLANMVNVTGCTSPDGTLYFAGSDEILYFNPDKLSETSPYIHPEVTSVNVMNKNYPTDITKPLYLSYRDNYISFTFSAFDFLNEKVDQFAYYLEGFDKDWNYCGNRHFTSYTNLPGGSYTLKLKVQNAEGIWVETIHPIHIHITTPYYKTWWFFLLCGLSIFGLGYLFYYLQIQRELEAERLRTRLARDLHDDVGSSLSSISIISNMATKKQEHGPEEVRRIFTKISETSQKTLDSISDLVWTLNPENDMMEDLFMRMRVYMSEILEAKEILYEFNVTEETGRIKITMDKRKNLYLIFKETINNIAKYSKCTKVLISIKLLDGNIAMEVADNGIGFIVEQAARTGNGLKNMQQRASQMGGTITIKSKPGEGTGLKLVFPYT